MIKSNIRKAMLLNPSHDLWDKDFNKWDNKDKDLFEKLCISKVELPRGLKLPLEKNIIRKKVIRLSDGKEYNSIQACRIDNKFYNSKMYDLIKEGIKFKVL